MAAGSAPLTLVFAGSSTAVFRFDRASGAAMGSVSLGFVDGPRGLAPLAQELGARATPGAARFQFADVALVDARDGLDAHDAQDRPQLVARLHRRPDPAPEGERHLPAQDSLEDRRRDLHSYGSMLVQVPWPAPHHDGEKAALHRGALTVRATP